MLYDVIIETPCTNNEEEHGIGRDSLFLRCGIRDALFVTGAHVSSWTRQSRRAYRRDHWRVNLSEDDPALIALILFGAKVTTDHHDNVMERMAILTETYQKELAALQAELS